MNFDTHSKDLLDPVEQPLNTTPRPAGGAHVPPAAAAAAPTVILAPAAAPKKPLRAPTAAPEGAVDKSDDQLLAWLDQKFGTLLQNSLVPADGAASPTESAPATGPHSARPARPPQAGPGSQKAQDEAARAAYLARSASGMPGVSGMPKAHPGMPQVLSVKNGRPQVVPRTGLGPRLFIGFDAEWTYAKKGRNRILSMQFVLYGPTGKTHEKFVDLSATAQQNQRIRINDLLDVLLEEAEKKKVFVEWPREVVLVGFFLRGDLAAFADFGKLRKQLDGVGGSLGTVSKPAKIDLPMNEARQARLKTRYQTVVGDDFNPRLLKVRIIDASCLTPPGSSLDKVGAWLGQAKIKLPADCKKSDMFDFKRRHPEKFREYAMHDARLAVLYAMWVLWFSDRYLGIKGLSNTVSGLSVRLAQRCMRADGVHPDVALNFTQAVDVTWNHRNQRPMTRSERVPTAIRRWLEPFFADVYAGGRNEAYWFGPSRRMRWYDSDLSGAYLTGLAYFMTLDYDKLVFSKNVNDFIGQVAGFAQVKFQFPAVTKYPCLPVALDTGLCFPLSGVSLCTSPEIDLAIRMGATVEILFGCVIPYKSREQVFSESAARQAPAKGRNKEKKALESETLEGDLPGENATLGSLVGMTFPPPSHGDEGYRLVESFAIFVRRLRLKFKRKTLPHDFCKLLGNGFYGKMGQGFKGKGAIGPKDLSTQIIGQSAVSEPALAALVCGFIRATTSEILWKLPEGAQVLSLTTDGALMSVPISELDLSGTLCQRYQALVDRVAPGTHMLEAKHQVQQVFIPRTRGCFTVEADGDHPAMCAKAGHKVVIPEDASPEEDARLRTSMGESDWMIRLALERTPGQKLPQESFFSLREQLLNEWDLQKQLRMVSVSLDFDFKRKPAGPLMVALEGRGEEHLAFDTVPWDNVEEAQLARTIFGRWRTKNNLKTMEDWHSWQAAFVTYDGNRRRLKLQGGVAATDEPNGGVGGGAGQKVLRGATGQKHLRGGDKAMLRLVMRTFLGAYTNGLWGLESAKDGWTYKALAAWMTEQGYPASVSDVKNARRSSVDAGIAARTPEVVKFLEDMRAQFPTLEVDQFYGG